MHKFTVPALACLLLMLTGCEPKGPATDIKDRIDEVTEYGSPAPALPAEAQPEPEVLEQHKQHHQQVVEQASQEAEDKLNAILDATADPR